VSESDLQNLVLSSFSPNLSRSGIYEILGALARESRNNHEILGEYVQKIVAKKLPIDKHLEYGLYALLEDKGVGSMDHNVRKAELCNQLSEEITADAVRLSSELNRSDNSNPRYLLLHALNLLYNWRPLEAWPYAVRACEISPQDIAGYNLLLHIALRARAPGMNERLRHIYDGTRTRELQVDLLRTSNFKILQRRSKARVPAILINTQHKSGTIYLRGLFSSILSVPHCQVCVPGIPSGRELGGGLGEMGFFTQTPLRNWLNDLAEGGAVCVDHFDTDEQSLQDIVNAGINRMVVHTRDFRKSALSALFFQGSQSKYAGVVGTFSGDYFGEFSSLEYKYENFCRQYIPRWQHWLKNWITVAENRSVDILFVRYEDFVLNEKSYLDSIMQLYGLPSAYHNLEVDEVHKLHFRSGDPDEYDQLIPKEVRSRIAKLIDPEIAERFGWTLH
jgi:hypothetical protein